MKRSTSLLLFPLILGSCLHRQDISLCTDKPELTAYVEVFNTRQDDYKLEVAHEPDLRKLILDKDSDCDLIIGTDLADSVTMEKFYAVNRLFDDGNLDSEAFYPEILALGRFEGEQHLLPINFDLPVIVYNPALLPSEITGSTISLEEIRKYASDFNQKDEDRFVRMGFSPLWQNEFSYLTTLLFGVKFRMDADEGVIWQEKALNAAIEYLHELFIDLNGSVEMVDQFRDKYMKSPYYQLLAEGRILFYLTDMKSFIEIPQKKREILDYRWLARENRVPVLEDVLFAGIPRSVTNRRGAISFLEWFFTRETQTGLLEINRFKRLVGIFGIANGFSALRIVNERDMPQPQFYPLFIGHMFSRELLSFPEKNPTSWQDFKNTYLLPWLAKTVAAPREDLRIYIETQTEARAEGTGTF